MASIEFIQKRIEGKEKEITKLTKKLERIRKAESFNWDDSHNPYYYNEYDLKRCLKDLESAHTALEGYKAQLVSETEKANSRDVQVILDFLNAWKERNMKFYAESFERFVEAKKVYDQKCKEHADWWNHGGWKDDNCKEIDKAYEEYRKNFRAKWAFVMAYTERELNPETRKYELVLNTEGLKKDLDQEANRKYDFIIERTNYIVGQITDASNLYIGNKGDLNGFIIGTKGTAKVQTIGAGGYNVQCYHFRTLINKW